jgi:serine/threonine-protein kinase
MHHPRKNTLQDFLHDKLEEPNERSVLEHLNDCPSCRRAVEEIIGSAFNSGKHKTVHDQSIYDNTVSVKNIADQTVTGVDVSKNSKLEALPDADLPKFGIGHRFLVLGELARGGMGVVYRGFDRELKREVAIKVSLGEQQDSDSARFYREAQISGQLQHPGIIPVYEKGWLPSGRMYIAMKLVDGQTLLEVIDSKDSKTKFAQQLEVFGSVCQTMAYAHSRNFIHRDLKPENVMVGTYGEVLIMDWGLAKRLQSPDVKPSIDDSGQSEKQDSEIRIAEDMAAGETVAGQVFGTPAYMPPEQAKGEHATKRADVFAMGGILHQILTGNAPFNAPTSTMALAKSIKSDLEKAHAELDRSNADQELVELVKSCLAANPEDRPADAESVNQRFLTYIADRDKRTETARLEEARSKERLLAQQKRNRQIIGFGAAVIAALFAAAIAGFLFLNEKNARIADQARVDREQLEERVANENAVRESLAKAQQFQTLAASESEKGKSENWVLAINEIEKTEALVNRLGGGELKTRVADLQKELQTSLARSTETREFLQQEQACVEEIVACSIESTYHPQIRPYLDDQANRITDRLEIAYESIGVSPGDLSEEVVAKFENSRFKSELIYGLQIWAKEIPLQANPTSKTEQKTNVEWLRNLALKVDKDPFRTLVRNTIAVGDNEKYAELLKTEQSVSSLPTVRIVSSFLPRFEDKKAVLAYLFRAHQAFPMDFRVNWDLAGIGDIVSNRYDDQRNIAIQHYLVCYSLQPNHPNALLNVGASYVMNGKAGMAIEVLEKLAVIAPEFPMTYLNLAHAYFELEQLETALQHCDKVLKLLGGREPSSLALRGEIHFQLGNVSKAIEDSKKAVELVPSLAYVHENLANIYQVEGQLEKAIASLKRASELEPDSQVHRDRLVEFYVELSQQHRSQGKTEEAIEMMINAIELKPENLSLKQKLGHLYVLAKEWELAENSFRAILQEDKNNSNAIASIANAFLAQNKPDASEALLRSAMFDGVNSQTMQFELAKAMLGQSKTTPDKKAAAVAILKQLAIRAPHIKAVKTMLEKLDEEQRRERIKKEE